MATRRRVCTKWRYNSSTGTHEIVCRGASKDSLQAGCKVGRANSKYFVSCYDWHKTKSKNKSRSGSAKTLAEAKRVARRLLKNMGKPRSK